MSGGNKANRSPEETVRLRNLLPYAAHRVGLALSMLVRGDKASDVVEEIKRQYSIGDRQAWRYLSAAKMVLADQCYVQRDQLRAWMRATLIGQVLTAQELAETASTLSEKLQAMGETRGGLRDLRDLDKLTFDPAQDMGEGHQASDPETIKMVVEILESMQTKEPDLVAPYMERLRALIAMAAS